jgi:hypothetical protein
LERAYTRDVDGAPAEAIKLYRLGLSIIYEGLSITVPATGLGAAFHHIAAWRRDMNKWQQLALERYGGCVCVLQLLCCAACHAKVLLFSATKAGATSAKAL